MQPIHLGRWLSSSAVWIRFAQTVRSRRKDRWEMSWVPNVGAIDIRSPGEKLEQRAASNSSSGLLYL